MISKSTRIICANCEYWGGQRSLGPEGNAGQMQTRYERYGNCLCRESRFINASRKCDQRCKNFRQWAVTCQKP